MKKIITLLSVTVLLIAILTGCSVSTTTPAESSLQNDTEITSADQGDKVKLLSAMSAVGSYNGPYQVASFTIIVENIAFDKTVSIHLKDIDGEWFDIDATYVSPANGNFEVWKVSHNVQYATTDLEFVVKYEVAGATYWDNNSGQNYFLEKNAGVYLGDVTVLNYGYKSEVYKSRDNAYFSIYVALKNLSFDKAVTMVYTTDNWQTTQVLEGTFSSYWTPVRGFITSPNALGVEMWHFSKTFSGVDSVEYAISYEVDGQTYWDNNFNQNYTTDFITY